MSKPKTVILAVGGTGGHLFPAQGFAKELLQANEGIRLLFAGQGLSENAYFDRETFSFCDIRSLTPFRGNLFKVIRSVLILCRGVVDSLRLLSKEKPHLVVGFGSFHAFPVLCAACIKRVPIVLFESNAVPGKVIRVFSRRALFTGIYITDAKKHLKGKTIDVEIPLLAKAEPRLISKEEAKRQLGLESDLPTLLVFGGSQGARQINLTTLDMLPLLKQKDTVFQLIHLTGNDEMAAQVTGRCQELGIPCYCKKFEKHMQRVWSAADLVICRSGAMTLSELLYYEVPGILIPYPNASDQHQLKNALFLEQTVRGGVHLKQGSLDASLLTDTVLSLMNTELPKRSAMQKAIRCFNENKKKSHLGALVTQILKEQATSQTHPLYDSYHFIGIGGIGMSGLATILVQRGVKVSGSDCKLSPVIERLQGQGATIHIGHDQSHVKECKAVVRSTDIQPDNLELIAAREQGIAIMHRSELLSSLMQGHRSLLVSGTHGKTTTSSLLAHVLVHAGLRPTYAIGGIVRNLQSNAGYGKGEYFVAEADESDGSFLNYSPFGAIITNIDNDHLNYWQTMERAIAGFVQFEESVSSEQHLFWCGDDEVLSQKFRRGYSYGFAESNDLVIKNFVQRGWHVFFDLCFKGNTYTEIEIPLVGAHNVLNAAAVFGLCLRLEIAEHKIRDAFVAFQGIGRRAERKGECRQIAVFDDYAHHPSEIFATLRAVKQAEFKRRLVVAFQPHRYSRTRDCFNEFGPAFDSADIVVLTDIYAASEAPLPGITSRALLEHLKTTTKAEVRYSPRAELTSYLAHFLQEGDVLVTMGAGDITQVGTELLQQLGQPHVVG